MNKFVSTTNFALSNLALLLMAGAASPTWAGIGDTTNNSGTLGRDYFAQLIGGLALVLLSIIALAWILKKLNRLPNKGHSALEIVASLSVGQRERLIIVRNGDIELLLGVAPGSITTLHVLGKGSQRNSGDPAEHPGFSAYMPDKPVGESK